jgi:hypothetical protein
MLVAIAAQPLSVGAPMISNPGQFDSCFGGSAVSTALQGCAGSIEQVLNGEAQKLHFSSKTPGTPPSGGVGLVPIRFRRVLAGGEGHL